MKNTIVIVGPMCSGKTTLAKWLEKHGFERVVTYTTRPMREGEVDGVDYHFISEEEFEDRILKGYFAEYRMYKASFGTCWYGSAKKDYVGEDRKVIVLDPVAASLPDIYENSTIVYLRIRPSVCIKRALKRGDDPDEIYRRMEADAPYFETFEKTVRPFFSFGYVDEVSRMGQRILLYFEDGKT